MAVTYRTCKFNTNTAATSIQVNKPIGTVENDLLICEIATDGNAVITTLTGWTLIQGGGVNPVDNTPAHGVYYKKATGSEPANYTWVIDSTESISGCILRYDGQDLTNPINTSDYKGLIGSENPAPPIVTTTVDGCMIVRSAAMDDDDTPYSIPGGTNERLNLTANTHGHMIVDSVKAVAGNTSDLRFSQNAAEEWYCFTIAIAPAGGPQTFYQNSGQGANAPTGILNKQGYKDTGGYATVLVGSLGTASIFLVSVGAYAMAIVGTLGTVITFVRSVGSYAMTLAGGLKRQTHKAVGGYSMTIVGILARQSFKCIGGHIMAILGTLSTATIFLQTAGQAALTISGSLIKKIFVSMGNGAVSSVGSLVKKTSIFIGKAATSILGTLSTATTFLQDIGSGNISPTGTLGAILIIISSVGGAAMNIVGVLSKTFIAGSGAIKRGIALLLRFM